MRNNLIYLISFLLLFSPLVLADGLNINGFEPPAILFENWLLDGDNVGYARHPISYDLRFFLSESGCIDSLKYDPDDKLGYIDGVIASLRNIDFSPGRYLDKAIPTILPARLEFVFDRNRKKALLKLPFDSNTNIKDRNLVGKILEMNNFSPASIEKIPSYFCHFDPASDYDDYPFAVYKIALDLAGQIKEIETVFSNYKHYSDMFSNVLLYAEFQPAKFKEQAIMSNIFVTVRFFQRIGYPAEIWPLSYEQENDFSYDYHRISYRPYLDSLVNPPFPANLINGGIVQQTNIVFVDTIQIDVTIDTLGNIGKSKNQLSSFSVANKISKSVLKKLKYLPARDIKGNKVNFDGQLTLIFKFNSKNIRIVSNWLRN